MNRSKQCSHGSNTKIKRKTILFNEEPKINTSIILGIGKERPCDSKTVQITNENRNAKSSQQINSNWTIFKPNIKKKATREKQTN